MEKLNKVINKLIRICIRYLKLTPVDIILAESCEPNLKLRILRLGLQFYLKQMSKISLLVSKILNPAILDLTSIAGFVRNFHFLQVV